MTEKTPIPEAYKTTPKLKTKWRDLTQGWYVGKRYDGYMLLAHTNGLPPDDPKSNASVCQLTPQEFQKAMGEAWAFTNDTKAE